MPDIQRVKAEILVREVIDGLLIPEAAGSTSEVIMLSLVFGEFDKLPHPFTSLPAAWDRLDATQREVVQRWAPAIAARIQRAEVGP